MHLALKSAMSRIPYTNKVGETLSSIADSAAAYSLRALGGGDPRVARVRRSSDDAEKDFTASDISGGALVNWVGSGNDGFVTSWYDQSGNDNHATQSTATSQPKIVDGGTYLGELDFDGGLDIPTNEITSILGETITVCFTLSNATNIGVVLECRDSSTLQNGWEIEANSNTCFINFFQSGSSTSFAQYTSPVNFSAGALCTVIIDFTNSNNPLVQVFENETNKTITTVKGSTGTYADSNEGGTIGYRNFSNQRRLNADISEFIIYDSDQSSNREAIETNINNYYDIY